MKGVELVDLAALGEATHSRQCEICVVGAGAAGIYLSVELASRGFDVILLEAGDGSGADASTVGFDAQFAATRYPGATEGRSFGLGGTTSRWGGLLAPHTPHDLREVPMGEFDSWRHIVQIVADKTAYVLAKLGWRGEGSFLDSALQQAGQDDKGLHMAGLDIAAGLFLPFRKKNFVNLLKQKASEGSPLRVFYNAVAKSWRLGATADLVRIQQAVAVSSSGNQLSIAAHQFVVAAGAIESTRILLELDHSFPNPVIREGSVAGRYLGDHLSLSIADVALEDRERAGKLFAPWFSNGWMRGFRLLESKPPADAPRAFFHFIFENQNPGFALAKEALGALQGRRRPKISAMDTMSGLDGLARLAYYRYVRSVLYVPPGTKMHLQLDIEQLPLFENAVTLGDELDRYGRRMARIQWRISEGDIENLRQTADRFLRKWLGVGSALPTLVPRVKEIEAVKPHDAYHPVGTCRMGRNGEAVVDENLKVWGLDNLWVVSTAVLPSAGTANPTFTMLCLAQSLAEHFERQRDTAT